MRQELLTIIYLQEIHNKIDTPNSNILKPKLYFIKIPAKLLLLSNIGSLE